MNEKELLTKMYWEDGMTIQEIADAKGWKWSKTYYRFRRKYKIPTHRILWKELEITEQDLRETLNTKWNQMRNRVIGNPIYDIYNNYNGKPICTEQEFIQFCNDSKEQLLSMWNAYLQSGKELKLAPSIDRIDNSQGYTVDNLQFVKHGYNSWKDQLTPVEITLGDETRCFSSPADAARYWGVRADDIREVLRGGKYNRLGIEYNLISISGLLSATNINSLQEYYHKRIA